MQLFRPQGFKMGVDSQDLEYQGFLSTMYSPVRGPYLYSSKLGRLRGLGQSVDLQSPVNGQCPSGQVLNGSNSLCVPVGCMEPDGITPCGYSGPASAAQVAELMATYVTPWGAMPSYIPAGFVPTYYNGEVQSWFGGDASGGNPYAPAPGGESVNYGTPAGVTNQVYGVAPVPAAAPAAAPVASPVPVALATATTPPASPLMPIATPSIPISGPAIAASVAPASTTQPAVTTPPVANWFTDVGSEIISGIPNWGLVAAGLGLGFLLLGGKK
jgi:hypothetical protein